jgi:hypothetical protein
VIRLELSPHACAVLFVSASYQLLNWECVLDINMSSLHAALCLPVCAAGCTVLDGVCTANAERSVLHTEL